MKRIFLPLFGTSLLALTACGSGSNTGNSNDLASKSGVITDTVTTTMPAGASNPKDMPAAAGSASLAGANAFGPTAPHANDAEFMQSAAYSDQNEMQLSKLMLSKGATGSLKAFADKMITDHTTSTNNLKPIAAKATVTLPTTMDDAHKQIAERMQKLSGTDLQSRYFEQMVADHQMTANTMKAYQTMTKNPELLGFINQTLPVVLMHLTMAKRDGGAVE